MTSLYLAGRYVEPDGSAVLPITSPVTGEHLGDLPVATAAQVDEAVAAAAGRRWTTTATGRSTSAPTSATGSRR